jgi:DNA-directed RNA polymerase subunit E'/Rpb7
MATTQRNYRGPRNVQKKPEYSVYIPNMISTKIHLKMSEVGKDTKSNLERKIVQRTEGKCIPEGFVRPDSVKVVTYSSGVIKMNLVEFQVVFQCLICNPAEGHEVECVTKSITKAGIHAEVMTDNKFIPMKIFVARDHNYSNQQFGNIKENETIKVRIIGKRFELNDPYIVAIASLIDTGRYNRKRELDQRDGTKRTTPSDKPRITVLNESASDEEPEYVEEEFIEVCARSEIARGDSDSDSRAVTLCWSLSLSV